MKQYKRGAYFVATRGEERYTIYGAIDGFDAASAVQNLARISAGAPISKNRNL